MTLTPELCISEENRHQISSEKGPYLNIINRPNLTPKL